MKERWINLGKLVEETGLATRTLQYIRAQEPGILVTRERRGKTEYKQPDCSVNLRRRETEQARHEANEEKASLRDVELRKATADAQLAELKVKQLLGELISEEDASLEVSRFCERLRAAVLSIRSRHQSQILNIKTVPEAGRALDRIAALILTDLQANRGGALDTSDLELPEGPSA